MDFVKPIMKLVLAKVQKGRYTRACPDKGAPGQQEEDQVCAQVRKERNPDVTEWTQLGDNPLGLPPHETQLALQTDIVKELVNKIAWTLGSVYRAPYSNMRTPARTYAWRIVKQVVKDHGYPGKIAK